MDAESPADRENRTRSLWKKLDTQNEGFLDLKAFRKGLKKLDHPLKNADDLIEDVLHAADINNSGRIEYDEFRKFVDQTERELWQLFKSIDRNNDGNLDKNELRSAFVRAGLAVPNSRLDNFFDDVDTDNDGVIDFGEWRDFLLFMPISSPGIKAVMSYYQGAVKVTAEGDVSVSDETIQGIGYFLAGGISGVASRTTTAPLDRLKVYLIAQTGTNEAVQAVKSGAPTAAAKSSANTLVKACKELWAAGGIRSLFAGNGLNIVKVMPESAVKFGSYEAAKKMVARFEGHSNTRDISPVSQFIAGGVAGMVSQAVVYPLDTLKFRMQCETVPGGLRGTKLIAATAVKMWGKNGIFSFYRGLPMGLVGMFPYAAIDLGTFEYLKRTITAYNVKKYGGHEADAAPSSFATALIGGFSGAIGASAVYPLNLLRTRLQSQGTASHPRTYTGIMDVTRQTLAGEGVRGLFKGLTPNLLKVVPAVSITYVVYEKSKKALNLR
ncbi:mitochondrial carrier [Aureobasidium namibiae CBS 147.97]|uniref:Mitochondrial thiamine pyrophosphate carrier 1 n=1 Tax=Aureobasidium namibiae CBS 147.97 TaxID=1043004 RepID=A0A074XCU6_9PEZI